MQNERNQCEERVLSTFDTFDTFNRNTLFRCFRCIRNANTKFGRNSGRPACDFLSFKCVANARKNPIYIQAQMLLHATSALCSEAILFASFTTCADKNHFNWRIMQVFRVLFSFKPCEEQSASFSLPSLLLSTFSHALSSQSITNS